MPALGIDLGLFKALISSMSGFVFLIPNHKDLLS